MGSISSIGKQNGDERAAAVSPTPSVWEPWRRMRALLDWDPSAEMEPLSATVEPAAAFNAAFDIKETKDAYQFKADVPGVQEKDLEVTVAGNRLAISGKREEEKEEKSERNYTYERSFGSFSRSFTLPDGADTEKVHATLEKGVLTVSVPKKPEVQPKKIAVSSESGARS